MTILICTSTTSADACVDTVIQEVSARGGHAVRFETDRFPTHLRLAVGFDERDRYILTSEAGELDLSELTAVWMRYIDVGAKLPSDLDPSHRDACCIQSSSTFWAMLQCLPVFQLDNPQNLLLAPQKLRQLQLAREVGLSIPKTIATNDPAMVRDFAKTCKQGMIAKLVDSSSVVIETDDGVAPIFTSALTPEDMAQLDTLRLSPMLFQERVPKALELRITVVGYRVFVAAIDASASTEGVDDWRKAPPGVRAVTPYEGLPEDIRDRLLRLLTRVGLNFATVDMIVTPDGEYVFLEFNTVSGFAFVEKATGLPISATIADLLLGRIPPRV